MAIAGTWDYNVDNCGGPYSRRPGLEGRTTVVDIERWAQQVSTKETHNEPAIMLHALVFYPELGLRRVRCASWLLYANLEELGGSSHIPLGPKKKPRSLHGCLLSRAEV